MGKWLFKFASWVDKNPKLMKRLSVVNFILSTFILISLYLSSYVFSFWFWFWVIVWLFDLEDFIFRIKK